MIVILGVSVDVVVEVVEVVEEVVVDVDVDVELVVDVGVAVYKGMSTVLLTEEKTIGKVTQSHLLPNNNGISLVLWPKIRKGTTIRL